MSFLQLARKLSTIPASSIRSATQLLKPLSANVSKTKKGTSVLSVKWNSDKEVQYPAVWLRDNCQCPKCYQKTAMARLSLMRNLNIDIDIPKVEILENDQIKIHWNDGHQSHFKPNFFAKYGPNGTSADHCGLSTDKRNKQLWKSDHQITRFDFGDITTSKITLYNWLDALNTNGIAIVENVPANMDGLPKLIETVFGPEITHYGDYFRVEQKFNANNLAYTGATLGLHQDLVFYEKPPGVKKYLNNDQYNN